MIHTPLGYDPHHVMSVGIPLRENAYTTWAARGAYFEQLRAKVAETPGVTMAAISSNATPPRNGWNSRFEILGQPAAEQQKASINLIGPGYFAVLRIPLLEGRIWDEAENRNGAQVAVINRTLATALFPERRRDRALGEAAAAWKRIRRRAVGAEDRRLVAADRGHRGGCPERRDGEPDRAGGIRAVHTAHVDGGRRSW